ncbi:MAG TPA: hypothetical protein PLQ09_02265 [Prolixibacteraceae bacterium]|nr:hypothetical protein [Prolixibacteraceae bacterium]
MNSPKNDDCCWIVLATTGCSTDSVSLEQVKAAKSAANVKDDCCWIILATTGCTMSSETSQTIEALEAKAKIDNDCCWIVLATTGCSVDELPSMMENKNELSNVDCGSYVWTCACTI